MENLKSSSQKVRFKVVKWHKLFITLMSLNIFPCVARSFNIQRRDNIHRFRGYYMSGHFGKFDKFHMK